MKNNGLTIVVDFDGTCVTHEYPEVGKDIGAQKVLKKLVESGHNIVLDTMRGRQSRGRNGELFDSLQPAIDWFESNGIPLYGIQEEPNQKSWTSSTKAYGQMSIDDRNLGVPLVNTGDGRVYVNWVEVEEILHKTGWI